MRLRSRAAASAVRGLFGSLPLAVLPALLARHLTADEFAVWAIVVQVATYVSYLEFGVQTAIIRTTASAYARTGRAEVARPISAGLGLLVLATTLGALVIGVLAFAFPTVFTIPLDLITPARESLLILGLSSAVSLSGSGVHGALIGAGYHWSSAFIVASSRLISVALVVVVAGHGASLVEMAAFLGAGSVASSVLAHLAALWHRLPVRYRLVSRAEYRQLSAIVLTLGVGTVAMLLISGVDVIVVGIVEFQRVQPYSLATSLVLVFASGYTIIGAALLPAFSELEARNDRAGTERLLARTSVIGCSVLGGGLVVLVALARPILARWAGPYADQAIPVFVILASAQALRLSLLPAATFLFSSADHRYARRIVLTEASLNLTSSIVLGLLLGYKGVALGTLVGTLPTFPLMWRYVAAAGVESSNMDRPAWRAFLIPAFLTASAVALVAFVFDDLPIRCTVAFIAVFCLVRIGWREIRGTPTDSLNSADR